MYQPIKIATAAILACLMLVVTTTSHLGVGYCLCQDTVFLGECGCKIEATILENILAPCSCCSSKSCSSNTIAVKKSTTEIQAAPCTNCNVKLCWEIDRCPLHSLTEFKPKSNLSLELEDTSKNYALASIPVVPTLKKINTRGSPPDLTSAPASPVPLFITHSTYLI